MKKLWDRIPAFLKNKYLIAFLVFIVWLTFFDRNNLISQLKFGKELNEQRLTRDFYLQEIEKDSLMLHKLLNDSAALEKLAREKYLMKKDNEDLFIIVREQAPEKK